MCTHTVTIIIFFSKQTQTQAYTILFNEKKLFFAIIFNFSTKTCSRECNLSRIHSSIVINQRQFISNVQKMRIFPQYQNLPVFNFLTYRFCPCVCCAVRSSRANDWIYILCFFGLIVVVCLWGGAFHISHLPRVRQERIAEWERFWKVFPHDLKSIFKLNY